MLSVQTVGNIRGSSCSSNIAGVFSSPQKFFSDTNKPLVDDKVEKKEIENLFSRKYLLKIHQLILPERK